MDQRGRDGQRPERPERPGRPQRAQGGRDGESRQEGPPRERRRDGPPGRDGRSAREGQPRRDGRPGRDRQAGDRQAGDRQGQPSQRGQRGGRGSGWTKRQEFRGAREPGADEAQIVRRGPEIPEDITGQELDKEVRAQLRTMSRAAAERVARHLVAAGRLLDEDPDKALEHAEAARADGGRLAVVREACGVAAYTAGRYEKALAEFRAARRISGSVEYLPMMADCERGLSRPERALELAASDDVAKLDDAGRIELLIVEAGARRDLGETKAALRVLETPELRSEKATPWAARLRYAYADTLEALGRADEAASWFAQAQIADVDGETDADERYAELMAR